MNIDNQQHLRPPTIPDFSSYEEIKKLVSKTHEDGQPYTLYLGTVVTYQDDSTKEISYKLHYRCMQAISSHICKISKETADAFIKEFKEKEEKWEADRQKLIKRI